MPLTEAVRVAFSALAGHRTGSDGLKQLLQPLMQ
jgi:hypothetical protein